MRTEPSGPGSSRNAKFETDPVAYPGKFTSLDAESVDILNYKLQHKSFPHDTTGNQWFTESQFESYRRLGQHVVEEIQSSKGWGDLLPIADKPAAPAPPPQQAPSTPATDPAVAVANGVHTNGASADTDLQFQMQHRNSAYRLLVSLQRVLIKR